jgi:glycosyltransferase involved in cell wall biosynthesis
MMSRKKILWLCSWYPNKTGPFHGDFIQRHAIAAALYNDICVIHVTGDSSGATVATEHVINNSIGLTEHIIYYKKATSFLGKIISHYRWLTLCRQAVKKYIAKNGKPDVVHVHVPLKAGIAALWIKRKYYIPYAITEHWGIYNDIEVQNYKSKSLAFKKYSKRIVEQACKFVSVSCYLADGVNRLVTKKEYEVIPNVVDTDLFYYTDKKNSSFSFIHVSNMVPLKNAEGILKAFTLLLQQKNDALLIMVGDTDPAIRNIATGLGLTETNLSFRGEVSYQQVAIAMQQSDCLILFSNIENSPCVIGEALCCGLPVIATAVGGIPELVNESNSLLVVPKNETSLAAAMQQMMDKYAEYDRKKIAEDAKSKFSYPVTGKKLDEIYTAIISEKKSAF